ncbi:hypothetical protein [Actomonas aquatica]|uniref:Methyl-accepting transducer domain-containing protein n=1 Tax=Actomonas aquatica TaxID=2866162 RepID=A0ABZ1CFS8_9BACT|nr:hypothetical protein [Opitutus sp. WL0086]WRQ89424.1 hypothetical protein K1X11_008380 [Opitutus sp. WL0086]
MRNPFSALRGRLLSWLPSARITAPNPRPAISAIRDGRRNLQQTFHAFGGDLDEIDSQTRQLLDKCEELIELANGQSEGINLFQQSMQVLDQPLEHIDRSLRGLEPMLEHVARCDQHSKELLKCQLAMGEVLAPLRHMIVFFRIEAAQLEPEHQTTFLTVADEIHRLRELIDKTFDDNVTRLEAARTTIGGVHQKIRHDNNAYAQVITRKRAEIERAIETLGEQLSFDSQRDTQVRDATQRLNQEISQLVSALQYEDILTQRIDHVLKALHAGPPVGAIGAWMRLMSVQVSEVIQSMEEARQQLDQGIDRIVLQADELGEASIKLRDLDNSTASIDGMVQLLLEAFEDITEISAANVKLADDSYTALQPVAEVTENLSSVVIEVSLNIQLIALNAQVRSVQLGDGSGLEVLAARTAEISAELGELGDRTANEIIELRTVTHELLDQLGTMRDTGRKHLDDLRQNGAEVIQSLHGMRDRTLATLQDVCSQMENVRDRTNPKPQRLQELATAKISFERGVAWLEHHASDTPPTLRERELLAAHTGGYTMASQRQAHAAITGDDSDLGQHDDSLEFFVDVPDTDATTTHAEPEPAFATAFFEPEPATASSPATAPKTPAASGVSKENPPPLDDNIELF